MKHLFRGAVALVLAIVSAVSLADARPLGLEQHEARLLVPASYIPSLSGNTASGPPTSGTYVTGQALYNSNPSVGAPLGWICVSGGSPGTWAPFGTIGSSLVSNPASFSISVSSPLANAVLSGVVTATVQVQGFTLAKLFDASNNELVSFTSFNTQGVATATFNTATLTNGVQSLKATGWDGTPSVFTHTASANVTVDIENVVTPPPSTIPIVSPAFYISATGSDSNACTATSPCLTLGKAQTAMRASGTTKTTYVRAGTYNLASTLALTSADNGTTWSFYPPDGITTAIIDGANARNDMITITGGSNITINGLLIRNFVAYGIHTFGGGQFSTGATSGNTFINNDICCNTVTSWQSGGIYTEGNSPSTTVKNNFVHDLGSMGIALSPWFQTQPSDNIDGSVVANNRVQRAVQRKGDGGCIYIGMHNLRTAPPGAVQVTNNYVSECQGTAAVADGGGGSGIYLDDFANNVVVTGNVVGPPGATGTGHAGGGMAFEIHNGANNKITNNIVDLGSSRREFTALYFADSGSGMSGNTFTNNIVVSSYTGTQQTDFGTGVLTASYFQNSAASDYTIANNLYFNSAGGTVSSSGTNKSDSNPTTANPLLSGVSTLAPGSPAFNSPINFVPIVGGWGPAAIPPSTPPPATTPPSSTVTWDPATTSPSLALSNANLTATLSAHDFTPHNTRASASLSGKRYWEVKIDTKADTSNNNVGMMTSVDSVEGHFGVAGIGIELVSGDGGYYSAGSFTAVASATFTTGDYLMLAYDTATGKFWMGKNGAYFASGNPGAGTNPLATLDTSKTWYPALSIVTPNDADTLRPTAAACTTAAPAGFSNLSPCRRRQRNERRPPRRRTTVRPGRRAQPMRRAA